MIESGIHAREWIAHASALYLLNRLTDTSDEAARKLLEKYNWYIIPNANPDGYEYSRSKDRLWRKNRSFNSKRCRGVDLNRNFDFHWGESGASKDSCKKQYQGRRAFSEKESQAIRDFVNQKKDCLKLYIALHSFGQLWLTPWGHTLIPPKDDNLLQRVARSAVNQIKKQTKRHYRVGSPPSILYAASGSSADWVKGVAGVNFTYTIELFPQLHSAIGFLAKENRIKKTGKELWIGIKAALKELENVEGEIRQGVVHYDVGPRKSSDCFDEKPISCGFYISAGYCEPGNEYFDWMLGYCRKTCGFCTVTTSTKKPSGKCEDSRPLCYDWAFYGECDRYPGYMMKHCAKSCGACVNNSPTTATTSQVSSIATRRRPMRHNNKGGRQGNGL